MYRPQSRCREITRMDEVNTLTNIRINIYMNKRSLTVAWTNRYRMIKIEKAMRTNFFNNDTSSGLSQNGDKT